MKKTVIFVVLAMVLFGSCAAQSANDAQRIVGTWVEELGSIKLATYVFNANGTGTVSYDGKTYNIFWGVSSSGELTAIGQEWGNSTGKFFLSSDGRRMIWKDIVYQKK